MPSHTVSRPVSRVPSRRPTEFSQWTPARLFADGVTKGAWYDPSDLATMFQNSNGTGAVAIGDPVGYIADKSGNGYHAIQATAAARPVLRRDVQGRYYLEADGTDDVLAASFTAVSTDRAMMVAALQIDSTALSSADEAFSAGNSGNDNPTLFIRRYVDPRVFGGWRSQVGVSAGADWTSAAGSDGRHVFTCHASDANVALRMDGVQKKVGDGIPSSATFDRIGIMANVRTSVSSWAPGRFYGGVIAFRAVSVFELDNTETYMALRLN